MIRGKWEGGVFKTKKKSRVWSLTPGHLSQNLTLQCYWCVTEWKKV